jgi:hypothetical protein
MVRSLRVDACPGDAGQDDQAARARRAVLVSADEVQHDPADLFA